MTIPSQTVTAAMAAVGLAIISVLGACGDDQPQVSIEDHLEVVAGRQLSPAEVERQLDVATTMCGMDLALLTEIWAELPERQMAFQDFVFGIHCPDHIVDYALATGRALSDEAAAALEEQESRPASTSSTLRLPSSTTTSTITGPADSGDIRSTTTTATPGFTITAPPTDG